MASHEVIVPLNPPRPRDRLERPLRDLRISVMDRCNFRCPYCMPREQFHESYRFLKSSQRLSFEEILRLARLFVAQGVRKLRLTGGNRCCGRISPTWSAISPASQASRMSH